MSHREHDRLLEAKEQRAAAEERMRSAALRSGISAPRAPASAIPADDYYPVPTLPQEDEPEVVELHKPTPEQDEAWAVQSDQDRLRKYAEQDAVSQLDKLRAEQMAKDEIPEPKVSREPVRSHVREGFYWQSQGGTVR